MRKILSLKFGTSTQNMAEVGDRSKIRKRGRVTDLPPCHVCGEKSSGIHYGVNSCEACKAFFYRNSKRAQQMACEAEDSCQPDPGYGYRCASCRMRKCLALGMSLGGIKKGRYTFETRAKLKKDFNDSNQQNQTTNGTSSNESQLPVANHPEAEVYVEKLVSSSPKTSTKISDQGTSANSALSPAESGNSQTDDHTTCCTEEDILATVKNLSDLYDRHPQYIPEYYSRVKTEQLKYLERQKQKKKIFGKLDPLPFNEYVEIYFNTGIDVDGRLRAITGYYPGFEEACSKFVDYAKELPSFLSLRNEDQVALLKGAKTSFWMLSDYPSIDVENGLFTNQNYVTLTKEEIGFFLSEIFATQVFDIAGKLQRLNLVTDEVNVIRAFVIFNPEFCVTEEGRKCAVAQRQNLSEVLQYLLHKYHQGDCRISEEFNRLERELIEMNNEGTVQWIHMWSLYRPIVSSSANEPVHTPAMESLYE